MVNKEDSAPYMYVTESLLITASVDVHFLRNVDSFDILGVYLHNKTFKDVIIFMEGSLSNIMVNVVTNIYRKVCNYE